MRGGQIPPCLRVRQTNLILPLLTGEAVIGNWGLVIGDWVAVGIIFIVPDKVGVVIYGLPH